MVDRRDERDLLTERRVEQHFRDNNLALGGLSHYRPAAVIRGPGT